MKQSWTLSVAVVASLVGPGIAFADQCERVDHEVARRAMTVLASRPDIVTWCEPCSDAAPTSTTFGPESHVERGRDGMYQIVIDRHEVDLAYTFVRTAPGRFDNLAILAGCPTSGVSPTITTPLANPPNSTTYIISQTRSVSFATLLLTCLATSTACTAGLLLVMRRRRLAMTPRALRLLDRDSPPT